MKKLIYFLTLILLISFVSACTKPEINTPPKEEGQTEEQKLEYEQFRDYYLDTRVSYNMQIIDKVERNIPNDYQNEGLRRYPIFNKRLENVTEDEFNQINNENMRMRASSVTYDEIDENGQMYLKGEKIDQKLYRHSASEGNYLGDVSDEQEAVVKKITIYPDKIGSYVTGLYAPAGEVIKIEISEEDLNHLNYINEKYDIKANPTQGKDQYRFPTYRIIIGQKQETNSQENNIWYAKDNLCRMPLLSNTMDVNKTTAYVGSYLGGPLYIDLGIKNNIEEKDRKPITITVSGAVEYHHYIQGLTTKEDYERTSKSTAPFFELAVTDNVVRHSGPRQYATLTNGEPLSYDDCYEASKLWTKIANVSHLVPGQSSDQASISFLYEPFIAAGDAVAFPGRHWVNNPMGWMSGALDAKAFYKNGSWGNIHEYNHHHQNYGVDNNLEVSNNATSLLSYVLYTTISERRLAIDYNTYNNYDGVMGDNWNKFLDPEFVLYETLRKTDKNQNLEVYANFLHAFGVETFINATKISASNKPFTIKTKDSTWYYATTLASNYDMTYYFEEVLHITLEQQVKDYIKKLNLKPFIPAATVYQTSRISYNEGKIISSNTTLPYIMTDSSIILDFNKHLLLPKNFTFEIIDFTKPKSGTLEKVSKNVYKYTSGNLETSSKMNLKIRATNTIDDIVDEIEFEIELKSAKNEVLVNDYTYSSTDYNQRTHASYVMLEEELGFVNSIEKTTSYDRDAAINNIKMNHIVEMIGKIYIPQNGKYRFGLRNDKTIFVYVGDSKDNLKLKAYSEEWNNNFKADGNKGFELDLQEGDYLYFKIVVGIPHNNKGFAELGWSLVDNGNYSIKSIDDEYVMGNDGIYKAKNTDEVFVKRKSTPSFYDNIDLKDVKIVDKNLADCWDNNEEAYGLANLFDGNINTRFHSKNDLFFDGSKTFSITFDLNSVKTFSRLKFITKDSKAAPRDFKIYTSNNLKDFSLIVDKENQISVNDEIVLDFDNISTRYIKIEITKGNEGRYLSINEIKLENIDKGNYLHIDDENIYYSKGDFKECRDTLAIFGKSYETNKGTIKFRFTGKSFVIMSSKIDNNAIISINIDNNEEIIINTKDLDKLIYKSNILDNKIHEVIIKIEGKFNFDAIRVY